MKKSNKKGLEIYARKIKNDGTLESDTYTTIVTEDYSGSGRIINRIGSKIRKTWHGSWWGKVVIFLLSGVILAGVVHFIGWK